MGQTISEKILSSHAGQSVAAGDIVVSPVDGAMGHDARTGATMTLFEELGLPSRFPGDRLVFVLDHYAPHQPLNWPTCTAEFAFSQTDWALFSTTWAKGSVTIL